MSDDLMPVDHPERVAARGGLTPDMFVLKLCEECLQRDPTDAELREFVLIRRAQVRAMGGAVPASAPVKKKAAAKVVTAIQVDDLLSQLEGL